MEAQTSASNLILSMQEAINTGKPELALEQYEKANYWSKIAVPKFAAAIAAFQLGKYEEAFRYASYAQDISTNPDLKQQISELMERIPRGKIKTGSSPISEKDFLKYVSIPQQIEEKEHSA
jgi:tetratricopeptide (TPR) repeat protein